VTYGEFADKLLIALYQESENDVPYPAGITFRALIDRYGFPDNERWTDRVAKEWQAEGLADVSETLDPTSDWEVEITGRGMRNVEETYGDKDGVGTILEPNSAPPNALLTEDGKPLLTEGGDYIVTEDAEQPGAPFDNEIFDEQIFDTDVSVQSAAWTGLPRQGVLSPEASDKLRIALRAVEDSLARGNCSNEERAQARAYILAIQALAEAPEPPADLIWKLVERANSVAGIASLFVSLVVLFTRG
jgi:hypothetical protein